MKKIMLMVLTGLMLIAAIPAMATDPVVAKSEVKHEKNRLMGALKIGSGIVLSGLAIVGLFNMIVPKYEIIKWDRLKKDLANPFDIPIRGEPSRSIIRIMPVQDNSHQTSNQVWMRTRCIGTRTLGLAQVVASITGAVFLIKSGIKDCRGR